MSLVALGRSGIFVFRVCAAVFLLQPGFHLVHAFQGKFCTEVADILWIFPHHPSVETACGGKVSGTEFCESRNIPVKSGIVYERIFRIRNLRFKGFFKRNELVVWIIQVFVTFRD